MQESRCKSELKVPEPSVGLWSVATAGSDHVTDSLQSCSAWEFQHLTVEDTYRAVQMNTLLIQREVLKRAIPW